MLELEPWRRMAVGRKEHPQDTIFKLLVGQRPKIAPHEEDADYEMAKILDDTQNLTDLNEELLAEDIIIGKNAKSSLSAGKKIPPDTSSQDRPPPGAKGPTPLKVSNVPSTTTSVRGSAVFKGTHSTGPVLVSEPWVVDSPKNSQREAPRWITRMSSRMSALLRGGSQTLSGEFETSDDMDSLFFLDSFNEVHIYQQYLNLRAHMRVAGGVVFARFNLNGWRRLAGCFGVGVMWRHTRGQGT